MQRTNKTNRIKDIQNQDKNKIFKEDEDTESEDEEDEFKWYLLWW